MNRLMVYYSLAAILCVPVLLASEYKGPSAIVATRDGKTLYVVQRDAAEIAVVSTETDTVLATYSTGIFPSGVAITPDEASLLVTSGRERGLVQRIDATTGAVTGEVAAGHSPCSPVVSPDSSRLFLCNRFSGDVAEYALPALTLTRRITTGREPDQAVITPDGNTLFVAHFLPNDPNNVPEDQEATIDVACEIAAINLQSGEIKRLRLTNGSHSLHGLALSPDGKYLFATQILARFQLPTTQLDRGWINTNGLSVIDVEKQEIVNTVLLDDIVLGAANPWGVAVSPNGKHVYVTIAGTHEVCVIDLDAMLAKLFKVAADPKELAAADVPNDMSFLVGMKRRVKLPGQGPRQLVAIGSAVSNTAVYVGMYFGDTLAKVVFGETGPPKVTPIPLGPTPVLTPARRGEMHWNDATACFQSWLSCASCHPDARTDALNWDLLNDGLGNPKNAKSMVAARHTPPAMWYGVRETADMAIRTGYRFILFAVPNEAKCTDIEAYFDSLTQLPSPHLVDGHLSEPAERGKKLFESEKINCISCHPAPLYTDQQMHNVGTRTYYDKTDEINQKRTKAGQPTIDPRTFDTPTLLEVWRTAPYMHDGRYTQMKEVFTRGRHGIPDNLSEVDIDDLVEYVLSL